MSDSSKIIIEWSGEIDRLEALATKIREKYHVFVTVIRANGEIHSQW